MTFTQFRIFVAVLLSAAVIITAFATGFSVTALLCCIVSLLGAWWMAYWSPEVVIALQERYGLPVAEDVLPHE